MSSAKMAAHVVNYELIVEFKRKMSGLLENVVKVSEKILLTIN